MIHKMTKRRRQGGEITAPTCTENEITIPKKRHI